MLLEMAVPAKTLGQVLRAGVSSLFADTRQGKPVN